VPDLRQQVGAGRQVRPGPQRRPARIEAPGTARYLALLQPVQHEATSVGLC
jgi:hypothetical protein